MFMPVPANSLIQSAQHVTTYAHIHFWISKYDNDKMDVNETSFIFIENSSLQHGERGIFGKGNEVILCNQ